jgi:hypothetical protein
MVLDVKKKTCTKIFEVEHKNLLPANILHVIDGVIWNCFENYHSLKFLPIQLVIVYSQSHKSLIMAVSVPDQGPVDGPLL